MRAFITGLAGTELTDQERAFLREAQPWGFILFSRNVSGPGQLRRLVEDVRATLGRAAPALIDQEGGGCSGLVRRTGRLIRQAPLTVRFMTAIGIWVLPPHG